MKLSVPRLTARALGEPFQSGKQITRSSNTSITRPEVQFRSWQHYYQNNVQQSRHTSNNAPSKTSQAPAKKSSTKPHTSTTSSLSPSSISEHVRLLMREVPYPVAIITSTDPTGPPDTSSFRGMTVSSFNTVTLSPHPVISFNVRRPSETLNALLASRRFLVHLLAPGPDTAILARDFSKGNATLAGILSGHGDFEFGALDVSPETDATAQNEDTSIDSGVGSAERPLPVLRRRDTSKEGKGADFPFIFECVLHPSKIDVHDHSVILGTVVRAMEGESAVSVEQAADSLCLTYANTKFWKMGEEI